MLSHYLEVLFKHSYWQPLACFELYQVLYSHKCLPFTSKCLSFNNAGFICCVFACFTGYKPFKITHSSDYFDQLYEWAVKLIKNNLAYVCHQKVEDMRGREPVPSPWRDRPIKESLELFKVS